MNAKTNTFSRTVDLIGSAICAGTFEEGRVFTVQQLVELTGASRSIVREATQVLAATGLVEARQRVGIRMLPSSRWNPIDPRVVGWQLRSGERAKKIDELFELRVAIEPAAAGLAAIRRGPDDARRLLIAANGLAEAARDGDGPAFMENDTDFHRTMLGSSGNPAFFYLSSVIETALADRDVKLKGVGSYDFVAVDLHVELAHHIDQRRPVRAEQSMLEIVNRTKQSP